MHHFIVKPKRGWMMMTFSNLYKPFDKFFTPSDKLFAPLKLALVSIFVLFVLGFVAIWTSGNPAKTIAVADANLSSKELDSLQGVVQPFGEVRFFGTDLQEIHTNIAKLSWVEDAKVNRDWYQGVTVSAIPRKAVANFGSGQMVDANGVVFVPADKSLLMNSQLVTLDGKPEQAERIMNQMHRINAWFAPLGISVKDLILTERQTWVATFNNGFFVIVDQKDAEQKLYRLSSVLADKYKNELSDMAYADLRYQDGFVLKPKDVTTP